MGWMIRDTIKQLPREIRKRIQEGEDISQMELEPEIEKILSGDSRKKGWTTLRSGA
jgi:hypothetical protein